jgi:hypothetical protein
MAEQRNALINPSSIVLKTIRTRLPVQSTWITTERSSGFKSRPARF